MIDMILSNLLSYVLLTFGQAGVPLGMPPLPEDPVLAQIAPERCVWYFSSSGSADPDPKSKNQTEQLLAEPEVQLFISALGKAFSDAIQQGAPPTPEGKLLGVEGPKLIHTLLKQPTAIFVSQVVVFPGDLQISGGLVVATGDQTDVIQASLEKTEKTVLAAMLVRSDVSRFLLDAARRASTGAWHKLPPVPSMPLVEWGFRGKYLIVGIGEGSADGILQRIHGKPPSWLATLRSRLHVERVSTVNYVQMKRMGALIDVEAGHSMMRALGLTDVESVAAVTGLENDGCVNKIWVHFDHDPDGGVNDLLNAFSPGPLTAVNLSAIPRDAIFAAAAKFNSAELWSAVLARTKILLTLTTAPWFDSIRQFEKSAGIRLKEDLFEALGDSICLYSSPSEGGSLLTGLTIVVPIKDHDRLVKTNDLLVQFFRRSIAEARNAPQDAHRTATNFSDFRLQKTTFNRDEIYLLAPDEDGSIFSPAWCVAERQLVIALSPQSIRAFLDRDRSTSSLAQSPEIVESLKAGNAVAITYQDTPAMLKTTYPILQAIANANLPAMRTEGFDLDASIVPSLPAILRHVKPGLATLTREQDGLIYVSRQSLPIDLTLGVINSAWLNAIANGLPAQPLRKMSPFRLNGGEL